ncbi:MAG: hypothetical protein EOO96_00420 [Pedobacter sp.]|nr:MAG: hypothetical protein EOO96_00420 [Pedobacter sp.]
MTTKANKMVGNVHDPKDGFSLGVSAGTWFPTGENKVLGNSIMGGLIIDLKVKKTSVSLVFDMIVNASKTDTLFIKHNNEIVKRTNYFAGQLGFDVDYELYAKDKIALQAGSGLGYGNISYYNPNKDIDVDKGSLFVSPGVSAKWYVGNKSHLKFRLQYYVANYKLKDNVSTNFSGNYITTKLIYAW